jgi:hypothetical protein
MDKKECKRAYLQRPVEMGIFQVRNRASGKVFIGRALDLNGMLNSERFRLRNGLHANRRLQEDFLALGEESFEFAVLDRLSPRVGDGDPVADLRALEQLWLETLQPFGDRGYHAKKP